MVRDSLLATYGAQDLPDADIIGRIAIAKLWGNDVFVLDDRLHTVHVLGVRAASHEQVGRPGQGPGELAIPRGLALSHDRIYVGDERRVIHEYQRAEAVDEDTPKTIDSYLIDLNSGATRKIAFPYSGPIGVTDTRMALFTNDPWPKMDVFRRFGG